MIRLVKSERKERSISYIGPHQQLGFQQCWNPQLNNPWLNKIYKETVCYTERWHLELRKMILLSQWDYPLVQSILGDTELKRILIESTILDGAMFRIAINNIDSPEFHISAAVNLKKVNQWCGFFTSLLGQQKIL